MHGASEVATGTEHVASEAATGTAHAAHKAKIETRIGEVQADYKRRSEKLLQAWELTKQALAV